jgi:hypothetical protein
VRISLECVVIAVIACAFAFPGCSRESPTRLAVYGLSDRYVSLPDAEEGLVLTLGEDGTFVLRAALREGPDDIRAGAEMARGLWVPTAYGLRLTSQQWDADFECGSTPVTGPRAADTLASLRWVRGTLPSPADSATLVSWAELDELLHPRGGWGRRGSAL